MAEAGDCVIELASGRRLVCPAAPEECWFVAVEDEHGSEIARWVADEWRDAPEEVMGAILGAAAGGALAPAASPAPAAPAPGRGEALADALSRGRTEG